MPQKIVDQIALILAEIPEFTSSIIASLVIGLTIFSLRAFLTRFVFVKLKNSPGLHRWRRNSLYLSVTAFILLAFPFWLPSIKNLAAFLGLFGAGILLVFKEALLNVAGWFYIIIRKPFNIGNRISISNMSGDVIDVRLLDFCMIEVTTRDKGGQSTGRVVHLPNSLVFTQPLSNASKEFSFSWNEISLPLMPNSNWKKAMQIFQKVAEVSLEKINSDDSRIQESKDEYAISYTMITPRIYVEFKDGYIVLTLRHLTEPRNTRQVIDKIWRELLVKLAKERSIKLAGPMGHI